MDYCFISHTGVGGVAYAMAITCLRLQATAQTVNLAASSSTGSDIAGSFALQTGEDVITRPKDDEEAFRQGDYRDILSLTRVLANGPASKIETDSIIERYHRVHRLSFQEGQRVVCGEHRFVYAHHFIFREFYSQYARFIGTHNPVSISS